MVVSYSGIAGRRGNNPTKIVLHNDGGSQGATAAFYKSWLENHNPELGFAHEYIASDGTYQAENADNCAWHCANAIGNRDYYGIEICQSLGNEAVFKANEQKAFKRAAQLCKQWGLNPSTAIFPLHRELSSTDCPHRSFALHGKSNTVVKAYYVEQVKKYYNGGSSMSYKFEVGELVKLNPKATHYANRDKVSASDKAVTGIVTGVKTDKAVSNETKFIFVKALDNPKKINHWCLQRDVVSTGYKRVKK